MANIIISKFTDEEYQKAEKALMLRLASNRTSIKELLLNSLFLQINNPELNFSDKEMLEIYKLVMHIKNGAPEGDKAIAEARERYILDFIAEQQMYESDFS